MFCPKCGFQNLDDANFCEKCGSHLNAAEQHGASPTPTPPSIPGPTPAPVPSPSLRARLPKNPLTIHQTMMGICILMVVVIPLYGFYHWFVRGVDTTYGIVGIGQISQFFDKTDSSSSSDIGKEYLQLFTMRIALASPLLMLSAYAGLMLWQKRPGALSLAKKSLLAMLIFILCSHLIFPHFFGLSEKFEGTAALKFWVAVIILGGCYYLLRVSKQVKDYYEVPLSAEAASKPA